MISNLKALEYIFQILAFNTNGAAHRNVRNLLYKAQSRTPHLTAFTAVVFSTPQMLSIIFAGDPSDPFSTPVHSESFSFSFFFVDVGFTKKKKRKSVQRATVISRHSEQLFFPIQK